MKLAIQVDDDTEIDPADEDTAQEEPEDIPRPCAVLDLESEFDDYHQDVIASNPRGVRWFLGLHF